MCTCMHVDWTLGENLSSYSFILRHHTLFLFEKGSVTGLGSPIRLHRLSGKPPGFYWLQFPSTDHKHTTLPFFFFSFFFFQVDSGDQTLVFTLVGPTLYWPNHLPGSSFFSVIRGWTRWHFFPHFRLRELEGRCFQIVIMELQARLLGRLNLVTFVIFPNARISIITQTHMHSCTHTLTHSLISIKEAEKCHQWMQLLNSIFLMPAPCRPGMDL